MNLARVKIEIETMATNVWKEAEQWQKLIQRGRETMKQISTVNTRIFATENQLNNMDKPRELRSTEKRIQQMFLRLQSPLQMMHKVLESLAKIKDSTARMHNRLSLWIDDDHVKKHRIRPHLGAPKLLELLQFLCQRYDAEWEVKEMVVYHLEHISSSYELSIFVEAWCNCRHAGGWQFRSKMGEFYDASGRRRSFVIFQENGRLPYSSTKRTTRSGFKKA